MIGLRPIEEIKIGDRVLAQDAETGELAYKPVLGVTTRPPSPRLKIGLGSETIVAAPGHPFWVVGQGWRMTKQLRVGERFHTTNGAATIESIEEIEAPLPHYEVAYNLIVADFGSYFVGKQAVFVHDNTPRRPTSVLVPGLARQ